MEERVSLEQPPGVRSKDCCPVYLLGEIEIRGRMETKYG